jgi:hypothetical protein
LEEERGSEGFPVTIKDDYLVIEWKEEGRGMRNWNGNLALIFEDINSLVLYLIQRLIIHPILYLFQNRTLFKYKVRVKMLQ